MTSPNPSGVTVTPPGWVDPHSWAPVAALQLLAGTGPGGFALQNGTPTIFQWTAPADNQLHRVLLIAAIRVTVTETGGQVNLTGTDPSTSTFSKSVLASGLGTGYQNASPLNFIIAAGSTVTLAQGAALTLGAATLYAELWGG